MSHSHAGNIDTIKRIPDPKEPVPRLAVPTLALFIGAVLAWTVSTALALDGFWPWPVSTAINGLAIFALFTVLHEATHTTLSTSHGVNMWIGRVAAFFLVPYTSFRTFRFIHMQHHRFTNHDDGQDPDHYASDGPKWQAPLRWLTIDLAYAVWYAPRVGGRPVRERREAAIVVLVLAAVLSALLANGNLLLVGIACWLIPARLALLVLAWSFDYLPHHELHSTPTEDRFKATRNRIGLERLLSPVMLYQNYHLVHHLHPIIPFYRYIAVWRRNEDAYLAHDPALSTAGGRALTVEEYRALRQMD